LIQFWKLPTVYPPPLSVIRTFTKLLVSFSKRSKKNLKCSAVSYFFLCKNIEQYPEKSSLKITMYRKPLGEGIDIGPTKSEWIKSPMRVPPLEKVDDDVFRTRILRRWRVYQQTVGDFKRFHLLDCSCI
jgi:hypothetical protein